MDPQSTDPTSPPSPTPPPTPDDTAPPADMSSPGAPPEPAAEGAMPPPPPPMAEAPAAPPVVASPVADAPVAPPPAPAPPPFAPPPPAAAPPTGQGWTGPVEPQGPAPGFRFASHGARLVAYIVDIVIVSILVTIVAIVLAIPLGIGVASGSAGLAGFSGLLLFVAIFGVSIGYFPWFWMRTGQTPGMRLFRLRVVRDRDGGPVSGGQAVLRLIGYWISGAVFYLGYVWILIDSRRRGWHDLIAGTIVVETDQ